VVESAGQLDQQAALTLRLGDTQRPLDFASRCAGESGDSWSGGDTASRLAAGRRQQAARSPRSAGGLLSAPA
jgi:hypothetical protein